MLGASENTLIEMYICYLRSTLEMAVPLWSGALTQTDINKIERVQKVAMKVIQGDNYNDYDQSLEEFGLDTLDERREIICLKFARKCVKSELFNHWFPRKSRANTRSEEPFLRPAWKTNRYLTSSIPYLIGILNKFGLKKK